MENNIIRKKLTLRENFNYSFKYSFIYTVLAVVIFAIARLTGLYVNEKLRFINYLVLFPVGYFGVKDAFEKHGNHLNYFSGLMIGFLIGLLGQTWYAILFMIYTFIDPVVFAFLLAQLPQPLLYPHIAIGFILISEGLGASAILSLTMMQIFRLRRKSESSISVPVGDIKDVKFGK